MNPAVALSIVAAVVFGTIVFALVSVRRFRMEPAEFIVGNRSFGALLLWMLMAGEVYTTFTFLGAAGWAYDKGAPAFYIIVYLGVSNIIGYFYLPAVWRRAKARGFMTWPDFLIDRYGSKVLGMSVALLQFILIIPYVTLQMTGLQILLTVAGYGRYDAGAAVGAAFALITLFVFTAGIRGTAWASIIKDAFMLGAAVFAGIYLPVRFFGSPANMITHVLAVRPHWFTLPAFIAPYGSVWFMSTVILTALGGAMFPHLIIGVFSAKSEDAVRRNLMFIPLYNVVLVLMLFAGFTAILVVPGLKGPAADQGFVLVLQRYFPAWVVGLVCGAGCLAALLPSSVMLLGASAVVSRNVLGHTRWTRPMLLLCAVLALALWFFAKTTLVDLLLLVFNGITQIFPPVVLGLAWKRMTATAAAVGLIGGLAVAVYALHSTAAPYGINMGFVALAVNVGLCVTVALLSPARVQEERLARAAQTPGA